MLKLKPNCELCDCDLPPSSVEALICSYECTFCKSCVDQVLKNVCPNCGGGFTPRPIRPMKARREGVSLQNHPASQERVHTAFTREAILEFASLVQDIPPKER